MSEILTLATEADLEAALIHGLVLIYKHSPYCGLSSTARHEVFFFAQGNPDVGVHQVDVIHQRALSRHIAHRFGIKHESPQVILVSDGRAVFDASHRSITAYGLERELTRLRQRATGAAGGSGGVT